MSNDIPPTWHPYLQRKGVPVSYRGIAARAGLSHEAARRVVRGWSVKESTIRTVADAIGVDPEVVHELRGDLPSALEPWEPPAASALLSHDEREALSRLISLMTREREQVMEHERQGSASKTNGVTAPGAVVTPMPPGRTTKRSTGASRLPPGSQPGRTPD